MLSVAIVGVGMVAVPVGAASGPAIAHVPVTTAFYGQNIWITFTSTCPTGAACSARIYYRTTMPAALTAVPGVINQGGFNVAPAEGTATTVDGQQAISWSGVIPGGAVTTTGVDYFLEADQNGTRTLFPGEGTGAITPPVGTYLHITVVSPPLINHVPVPFAIADQPMAVEAQVSCSTGNCSANVYYRRTPSTAATDGGWSSIDMGLPFHASALGDDADLLRFRAEVPAASVDTMGLDYYIQVSDGHVQGFHPGTPYVGNYVPRDGTRPPFVHHHVHVLEPPHIVHEHVAAGPYRQDLPIVGQSTCPATRQCQATLYYRTTPQGDLPDRLPPDEGWSSVPMSVGRIAGAAGVDTVAVQGAIPAAAADTRGVDYFFSVTDGTTTSWWPGTSAADGPGVWVDGVRVAYHHVRVLEPPHIAHVPVVTAPALQDLVIEAQLTCATEQCRATILHNESLLDHSGNYFEAPMSRVAVLPSGSGPRVELWRGTIPASKVTTRGLTYFIHADDGYTRTGAPGLSYWGAYAPLDGANPWSNVFKFVVRVVDPPHPVHVPHGVAYTGEPLTIDAVSNCVAALTCTATLHWRIVNGTWQSAPMVVSSRTSLAHGQSLVAYRATIDGAAVVPPGLEYRIETTDGYVTESSPPYAAAVTARPDPGSQGTASVFVPPVAVGPLDSDVPVVVRAKRPDGTDFTGDVVWCTQSVAVPTGCLSSGMAPANGGSAAFSVRPTAAAPTLRVTAYADGLNVGAQDPSELPGVALVAGVNPPSPPDVTTIAFAPPVSRVDQGAAADLPFRALRANGGFFTGWVYWTAGPPGGGTSQSGSAWAGGDGTGTVTVAASGPVLQVLAYADAPAGGLSGVQDPTEVAGSALVVGTPGVTAPGTQLVFAPPVAQSPTGSTVRFAFQARNLDGSPFSGTVRYGVRSAGSGPIVFDGAASASGGQGEIEVTPSVHQRALQVFAYADGGNSGQEPTEGTGAAAVVNSTTPPAPTSGTELVFTSSVGTVPPNAFFTFRFVARHHDGSAFLPSDGVVNYGVGPAGTVPDLVLTVPVNDLGEGTITVRAGNAPITILAYADRANDGVQGRHDESEMVGSAVLMGVV